MKNIFKSFLIVCAAVSFFSACNEGPVPPYKVAQVDPYATNFVYFKTHVNTSHGATFSTSGNWKKQPDTVAVYPVQFRCTKPAPQDLKVTVAFDESLVATYNAEHGTSYKFFPDVELLTADSYTIKKGEYIGLDTLRTKITNFDTFLEGGTQKYLLPVKLTSASAGQLSELAVFYIEYDAAMLFAQLRGDYTGTKLDRSGWTITADGSNVTSTLTDGSKYSDVYGMSDPVITVDLGQVYNNLQCFGVEHYSSGYTVRDLKVEISVDGKDYKSLGSYDAWDYANAVLEAFDPQTAKYVRFTGTGPKSSYYGWDVGEINITVAE